MADQSQIPADKRPLAPRVIGTSATGGEVVVETETAVVLALFAAAPGTASSSAQARSMVEQVWLEYLEEALPSEKLSVLQRAGEAGDEVLRAGFRPSDPEGWGTAAMALFTRKRVTFAGTLGVSAYLIRQERIAAIWQSDSPNQDYPQVVPDAHLGGRPSDAGPLHMGTLSSPWRLRPGDRIVLSTQDLQTWLPGQEIVDLAAHGEPEPAAQILAQAAKMRAGRAEIAVAITDVDRACHTDTLTADEEWSDVLGVLEDIMPELTDPGVPRPITTANDLDATASFAPVRESQQATGDAVLSFTPAETRLAEPEIRPPAPILDERAPPEHTPTSRRPARALLALAMMVVCTLALIYTLSLSP